MTDCFPYKYPRYIPIASYLLSLSSLEFFFFFFFFFYSAPHCELFIMGANISLTPVLWGNTKNIKIPSDFSERFVLGRFPGFPVPWGPWYVIFKLLHTWQFVILGSRVPNPTHTIETPFHAPMWVFSSEVSPQDLDRELIFCLPSIMNVSQMRAP